MASFNFFKAAAFLLAGFTLAIAPQNMLAQEGGWVTGITEAINDVTLSASASGIIGKRPLKEGDFVTAGETILELDKRLEELQSIGESLSSI